MISRQSVTPDLLFPEAFERWIANQVLVQTPGMFTDAHYIAPRTEWDYRQYARALAKMFGALTLGAIHLGHIREYHRARAYKDGPWDRAAGANRIRKEVGMLVRILAAAGCWNAEEMRAVFRPLAVVESEVPRAMSPDEQARFLAVAAGREGWAFVLQYAVLALQTCASTNELRALRLGDLNLHQGYLQVRPEGPKNKFRTRTIPLESPEVGWAVARLVERARELGAAGPHHYLFPFMAAKGSYDPLRPMTVSGIKKRWEEVRVAADLRWLRPYDLRHTAITRMAEAGVPIAVIMSFAGHMSQKMQQHYTTVSMMAKRKATASVWGAALVWGAASGVGGVGSPFGNVRDISTGNKKIS